MNDVTTLLSADQILRAEDKDFEDIDIPLWGGTVRIQALSAAQTIEFVDSLKSPAAKKNSNTKIVLMSCVDAEGNFIFTKDQLAQLKEKSLKVLNQVANRCLILNELSDEEPEENIKND